MQSLVFDIETVPLPFDESFDDVQKEYERMRKLGVNFRGERNSLANWSPCRINRLRGQFFSPFESLGNSQGEDSSEPETAGRPQVVFRRQHRVVTSHLKRDNPHSIFARA